VHDKTNMKRQALLFTGYVNPLTAKSDPNHCLPPEPFRIKP